VNHRESRQIHSCGTHLIPAHVTIKRDRERERGRERKEQVDGELAEAIGCPGWVQHAFSSAIAPKINYVVAG